MIAIAESGSTKTQWAFIDHTKRIDIASSGFNAFTSGEKSSNVFLTFELTQYLQRCDSIYFYGAGVSNNAIRERIKNLIQELSPASVIEVSSDLLGAARASYGDANGIVAILGTGSNAGFFDGKEVLSYGNPSLGYILGDEGGGVYFGKVLLHAYFNNLMPDPIRKTFYQQYDSLDLQDVLSAVYSSDENRKYIASFTSFLNSIKGDWRDHIIYEGFDLFIKYRLLPLVEQEHLPISFVGSVAFAFQSELIHKLNQYGLPFKEVIQYPLERLVSFHAKL